MTYKIAKRRLARIESVKTQLDKLGKQIASILTWDEIDEIEREVLTDACNDVEHALARILGDGM